MGFLTSIKKTFNISGAEVSVATDDDIHSQGDRVSGRVTVRAGEYLQKGSSIWLELKEFWTETHSAGKHGSTTETVMEARENVSLAIDCAIQPGSEESEEF